MVCLGLALCSLSSWLSLYWLLFLAFSQQGAPEWNRRLVTLFHGVVIVLLTAYAVFIDGPLPFTHAGTENTSMQTLALATSLGFYFFDTGWCVYHHRCKGRAMLAHHLTSITGYLLVLGTGKSGCEACCVMLGSEITNPLLQTRWFLRQTGLYARPLGDAVDLLFVALFVTVRVGAGGVLLYCLMATTSPPGPALAVKALAVVLYVWAAWVFMVDIGRFALKRSRAKYEKWLERSKAGAGEASVAFRFGNGHDYDRSASATATASFMDY